MGAVYTKTSAGKPLRASDFSLDDRKRVMGHKTNLITRSE